MNALITQRWGISHKTALEWQNSPRRSIRFRYEAALSGAMGLYGQPTRPNSEDPVNLVAIERAAVVKAAYSVGVLWDWYNSRAQKATRTQLANRVHDLTQHYLRCADENPSDYVVRPKYIRGQEC